MVNTEIFRLDVFSAFGARNVAIFSQGKCAHVVLKNDVISNSVALRFEEIPCPENITCFIIKTNFGRYFVLSR